MNSKKEQNNKQPRSPSSLHDQLRNQIQFLNTSAREFDNGNHSEAVRLATQIRVLLHDTRASHSLLEQLGIKNKLQFEDTGIYREQLDHAYNDWAKSLPGGRQIVAIHPEAGLVMNGIDSQGNPALVAPLARKRFILGNIPCNARERPFDPWWHDLLVEWWTDPLPETGGFKKFSRFDLVTIMANQDGGTHVDPNVDVDYTELSYSDLGRKWSEEDLTNTLDSSTLKSFSGNVAVASVRQIAYEVLITLDRHLKSIPTSEIFRSY